MLEVIPAIDLKDGEVVNLRQGKFDQSTVYSQDPVETAGRWVDQGCQRLHIVDLDGALEGTNVSYDMVKAIAVAFPSLTLQLGGGIRDLQTIEHYRAAGVDFLVLGTKAVEEPAFVEEACRHFPGHIIVGLDGIEGRVATNGWKTLTDFTVLELARRFEQAGIEAVVYTDIARDGMMQGVNVEATWSLAESIDVPVIASGGVNKISDIEALLALPPHETGGIQGVITGRAIYEGTLSLPEAMALTQAVGSGG